MSVKLVDVVKHFGGGHEDDVNLWFDRFEVAIDITTRLDTEDEKKKEMARLMPVFLEGPAYKTWKQIPDANKGDLNAIKTELKRVFGRSKLSSWQQLKSMQLLPGERVDDAVSDIKSWLKTISGDTPVPEELLSLFLMDALPKSVADNIRTQHGENLRIAEVSSCAKALMLNMNDEQGAAAGVVDRSTRWRGAADAERSRPEPRREVRCYGCHRIGHLQRNCAIRCHRCGQRGHLIRECSMQEQGNERAGMARPDHAAPAVQLSSGE